MKIGFQKVLMKKKNEEDVLKGMGYDIIKKKR
jgi:hypothetical protein